MCVCVFNVPSSLGIGLLQVRFAWQARIILILVVSKTSKKLGC